MAATGLRTQEKTGNLPIVTPLRPCLLSVKILAWPRRSAGGFEAAVVRALLQLAVNRNLRAVHLQDGPLHAIDGFRFGD